ncbi:MAG TPA: hypothetical protein VE907_12575 [Gammaproteobacteria bacterium]|nr:hypothetical protein [Gammaproteobacteria bacterium]
MTKNRIALFASVAFALYATLARADDAAPAAVPPSAAPLPPAAEDAAASPAAPLAQLEGGKPLDAAALDQQRAKAKLELDKLTLNTNDQDGVVTGNTALDNTTGHNSIAGDAFGNASGFVSAVQNTGNNVLIQNSTIINVAVEP